MSGALVSDFSVIERAQIAEKIALSVKWSYVGAWFDISERKLKSRYGEYLPVTQLCIHLLDELALAQVSVELLVKALKDPFIGLNVVGNFVEMLAKKHAQNATEEKVNSERDGDSLLHAEQKNIEPETFFSELNAYREHIIDEKVSAMPLKALLAAEKAIYGTDSRRDLYEVSDESSIKIQSRSIVSLWSVEKLKTEGDHVKLSTQKFDTVYSPEHEEFRKLHSSAAFYAQPQGAFGSGFLVRDDIIVTAAHCVIGPQIPPMADIRFVFGFQMTSQSDLAVVPKDNVYSGTLIDYRFNNTTQEDWAVVRLTRKVANYKPLEMEPNPIAVDHPLYIIGHPCGLPMKVASGAKVLSVEADKSFFKANLDSFGGNSGSPVFSATTSKVVGILVRGQADFIWDTAKGAMVAKVFPTTGPEGEEVTKITEVRLPENKNNVALVAPVARRFQNLSVKVRHDLATEISTQDGKWKAIASYFSIRPDVIVAKMTNPDEFKCAEKLMTILSGKGVLISDFVDALKEYDMEGIAQTFHLA